ncbi:hypothetical protein TWF281_010575 [Arthrobotrys megalospora]
MKSITFILLAGSYLQGATAVPLLSSIGSALTILKEEDFLAQSSQRSSSAILIEHEKTFSQGQWACNSLSESLWSPNTQDFHAGVNSSLAYQVYLNKFPPLQLFWVGSPTSGPCRAISVSGVTSNIPCNRRLPTLCTHSGAWSNSTFTDNSPQYQITVPAGPMQVTGFRDAYGWRFDGIKYANFPGRFTHSSVREASGPINALQFGDVCFQNEAWRGIPPTGSEDCLYLNIATPYLPATQRRKLKPVLFWIHGGGFTGNSGNISNYDGVAMAARGDIVVVKINYRLGNFGYLAIDGTSITGNYGFGDMITALKWVRRNIAYFGGDPSKVTVAGDSAGAASVRALISTQKAQGLFHAGILESMPSGWGFTGLFTNYSTIPEATARIGNRVLELTSCDTAANKVLCLKAVDAALMNTISARASTPVVDGNIFLRRTLPITGGPGYMAHVPILIGANRDEGAMGSPARLLSEVPGATTFSVLKALGDGSSYTLNGEPKNISALAFDPAYPTPPGPDGVFNVTTRILTDIQFKCESWATAYSGAKHNTFPAVYAYEFNRTYQPHWWTEPQCEPPKSPEHPLGDPNQEYYKCHSGEVDFTLGMTVYSGEAPRDNLDIPYQQLIVDYWSSFIKWKNPNPPKAYLKVRNYWSTLNQVEKTGNWDKVNHRNPKKRRLQWNGKQVPLTEGPQCATLDLPLDYYE